MENKETNSICKDCSKKEWTTPKLNELSIKNTEKCSSGGSTVGRNPICVDGGAAKNGCNVGVIPY